MAFLALVCTAVIGLSLDDATPLPSSIAQEYATAKAKAGSDPKALVHLALWCEANGLDAERGKNLAAAVAADPVNRAARGLLGLVAHEGSWLTPDGVSDHVKKDADLSEKLAEYNRRRQELRERIEPKGRQKRWSRADAARAHVQLGMWCEKVGLKAEATAHFTSAVVLDPHNDATWKHLGCVRHNGRWMSPEQIASDREKADAQRRADLAWEPQLRKYRSALEDKSEARRDEARTHLAKVTDPLAVPSIRKVYFGNKASDQTVAVQLLGQIDSPGSSRALAELAVLSASDAVRSAAIGTLRNREPRDYAGMLVEMIQSPMTYQAQPVGGPGSPGGLIVDTPRFQMLRTYEAPVVAKLGGARNGYIGYDANGLPIAATHAEIDRIYRDKPAQAAADLARLEAKTADMVAAANLKAEGSQRRLLADIEAIETSNAETNARNQWVIPVLSGALDAPADLKDDEDAWHRWWYDKLGYRYVAPAKLELGDERRQRGRDQHRERERRERGEQHAEPDQRDQLLPELERLGDQRQRPRARLAPRARQHVVELGILELRERERQGLVEDLDVDALPELLA